MPLLQPIGLVYNPVSGSRLRFRPRRTVEEVAAALKTAGAQAELLATRGPRDGFARGEEAARRFPLVAVYGGDGTINEVLNGVVAAGTGSRVLVLPGGSVNVLARDFRIPLDACAAAALVRHGIERRAFLGRAGNRYFALMAGAGVDAAVVARVGGGRFKRTLGPLAFLLSGARQAVALSWPRLTVRTENAEARGYLAVVGNSPGYAGWFSLTPGADPGQPGFEVAVCRTRFPLTYYAHLARALFGDLRRSGDFVYLHSFRMNISADEPAWVQVDGELHAPLPIDIVSDGTSLQFLVPAPPQR